MLPGRRRGGRAGSRRRWWPTPHGRDAPTTAATRPRKRSSPPPAVPKQRFFATRTPFTPRPARASIPTGGYCRCSSVEFPVFRGRGPTCRRCGGLRGGRGWLLSILWSSGDTARFGFRHGHRRPHGHHRPAVRFATDRNDQPERRVEIPCGGKEPVGKIPDDLVLVATIAHCPCDRDEIAVPEWVGSLRPRLSFYFKTRPFIFQNIHASKYFKRICLKSIGSL